MVSNSKKMSILLIVLLISCVSCQFISDKIQETILRDLKKIENSAVRFIQQQFSQDEQAQNNRPIIGILTEPPLDEFVYPSPYTYIVASYVKYIEGGGAQVVPVQYDMDEESLIALMGQINGILIPGGDVDILNPDNSLTTWGKTVQTITNYTIAQYKQGIIFPVWATCLGFQSVITVVGEEDILVFVNHTNSSSNLMLLETNLENNFFAEYPADLLTVIETEAPFFFNHNYGVQQAAFMANSKLTNLFEITSLSTNYNGTQFISSIQGKNGLPIFGSQFHPEKNAYEWNKTLAINHGQQAVEISQYLQDFFINQARNSFNKFETQTDEDTALIYNYHETPTPTSSFTSAYFFSKNILNEDMFFRRRHRKSSKTVQEEANTKLNLYPIIGVITEPSSYSNYPASEYGELASSYVKFLESAGARVVPILFDSDDETINFMFSRINGLVFPGGAVDLFTNTTPMTYSTYTNTVKKLLTLAFDANKNGDFFPVWAICLGFETTLVTMGQDYNNTLLEYLDDINRSENITLVGQEDSILFADLPFNLYQYMTTQAPMYFDHYWGITVEKFKKDPILTELFSLTSIAYTVNGTEFVGSIEAKNNYPIIASQFHPEKPPNEWWSYLDIDHTPESIEIAQYLANTFVNLSRKNFHKFDSQTQINQYMIWNYCAEMQTSGSYMTVYFPLNANQQKKNIVI